MIIKESKPWLLDKLEKGTLIRNKTFTKLMGLLIYTLVLISLISALGITFGKKVNGDKLKYWWNILQVYLRETAKPGQQIKVKPETVELHIKFKNYQKLAFKRETALQKGFLLKSSDDYVPAKIVHQGKTVRVKMRLKGDYLDHLKSDKHWSYRVKVKDDETLFGMKVFSLQKPWTRRGLNEWLVLEALKREGILTPRYQFVKLLLNGDDLGMYAVEEHFNKFLIESNRQREGAIVKFNEDTYWAELVNQDKISGRLANGGREYIASIIDGFQVNKQLADPVRQKQYLNAVHLLEAFRQGKLSASEAFDVEKMARFYALAELFKAQHALNWTNRRFYLNPVTSRLEPIGFDASVGITGRGHLIYGAVYGNSLGKQSDEPSSDLDQAFFQDPVFFETYLRELERITKHSYLDELFSGLETDIKKNKYLIRDIRDIGDFSLEKFYQNHKFLRTVLEPVKLLNAYTLPNSPSVINIGNVLQLPVEVLSLKCGEDVVLLPSERIILPGRAKGQPMNYQHISFSGEGAETCTGEQVVRKVAHRILGTSRVVESEIILWPLEDQQLVQAQQNRNEGNLRSFEFVKVDEEAKIATILPGRWTLEGSIIVPQDYSLRLGPGTEIDLLKGAKIISYAPVVLSGTQEEPIWIRSSDGKGQGIAVLGAKQQSSLEHVVFENLTNPAEKGWTLTGAVTFYESSVQLQRCAFLSNQSEDALNLVRSNYSIRNSLFSSTQSDAFDADFSDGTIQNTVFRNCGNDCIDVSGSVVTVKKVTVEGSGDKGFSVGEQSEAHVSDLLLKNVNIGIASKDKSLVKGEKISISGGNYGIVAFQKKSEFGPASAEVNGLSLEQVTTPYQVENGSQVRANGQQIPENVKNLANKLYENTSK
ncbi:MAG: CotH kinase family protein [Xenococcaceae cyanobacterium MO_234.B1]|nr:CotH kinase family protein [Xenococcaceae cyanobacterium MO_234.B1]